MHKKSVHTLKLYIFNYLNTAYHTQLFIQMTQISQSRSELWIKSIGFTELYPTGRVFVFVCDPTTIVLEQWLREKFVLKVDEVAGGWTELYSGKLHGLYWWVNGGGWWAERDWDRWERRNGEWMVVGGELKESGTGGTGEMVSEWWWVVSWKRVGQVGQEKWWVNGGGWWPEREWDKWDRRNG